MVYHYVINLNPVIMACGTTKDGSIGLKINEIDSVDCKKCIASSFYKKVMIERKEAEKAEQVKIKLAEKEAKEKMREEKAPKIPKKMPMEKAKPKVKVAPVPAVKAAPKPKKVVVEEPPTPKKSKPKKVVPKPAPVIKPKPAKIPKAEPVIPQPPVVTDKFDDLGNLIAKFNDDEMDKLRIGYAKAKRQADQK